MASPSRQVSNVRHLTRYGLPPRSLCRCPGCPSPVSPAAPTSFPTLISENSPPASFCLCFYIFTFCLCCCFFRFGGCFLVMTHCGSGFFFNFLNDLLVSFFELRLLVSNVLLGFDPFLRVLLFRALLFFKEGCKKTAQKSHDMISHSRRVFPRPALRVTVVSLPTQTRRTASLCSS